MLRRQFRFPLHVSLYFDVDVCAATSARIVFVFPPHAQIPSDIAVSRWA